MLLAEAFALALAGEGHADLRCKLVDVPRTKLSQPSVVVKRCLCSYAFVKTM
jgi:hypothetical protein